MFTRIQHRTQLRGAFPIASRAKSGFLMLKAALYLKQWHNRPSLNWICLPFGVDRIHGQLQPLWEAPLLRAS